MNSKKLIIFEYPILFNILNEISEVLNFDLIQTDRNHLNDIEKKLTSDFLVISKDQNSVKSLQKEVWEYGSDLETHTVETHIYRLRKKIKEKFKDDNFIISSKEGYIIN